MPLGDTARKRYPRQTIKTDNTECVAIGIGHLDPFRKLLGEDWSRTHWYETAEERDAALAEMSRKHEYSRPGDRPALSFEKVLNFAGR